ncbi:MULTISPECIES: UDP-glucose 4-epimerase GalE [Microbacterium]|uniref:UDP-glucose 4-epimerase GalE n=1 Tax=Microbacterium TaxID=33882 RepID=UPI00217D6493|nr:MULTISPECIES: UDP-glucose 4-epimerase GalE [Microbacterium]UWF77016.1 UDP-glucose 4-epimerase GalE [Microbacterium neungamense]WCM55176.1 UDP-glucose 4-epimerase GalE [Microbacterium sp. EF45047]
MRVLLTGGAGFIGAHTAIALAEAGHEPLIIDDLSNAHADVVARVESIISRPVPFEQVDCRSAAAVQAFIEAHAPIDAVIHLAGLKAVAESTADPVRYYDVNISSAIAVLKAMAATAIDTMIFSSSATVYGFPEKLPVTEETPTSLALANPYGKTKRMIEEIIADAAAAHASLRAVSLRYFNPVGAHPSGLIGESPRLAPTNLMPIVVDAAAGRREAVQVFGSDYDTVDGTGVRDFIHVQDLAWGHVKALETARPGYEVFNLGTGEPVSVLQLIRTFEKVTGVEVPYVFCERRPGDVAVSYADPSKAERVMGWKARLGIADACADAWNWEQKRTSSSKSMTA